MVKSSTPMGEQVDRSYIQRTPGLIRGLGLWAAIAVVVGSVIGQAVFLVGSDMARVLGSVTAVIAAWVIGGFVALCGSFCYAELGAAIPEAGGDYIYIKRGLGPVLGYLFGWTNAIIIVPALGAVIAAGFLRFAEFLFPTIAAPLLTIHIGHLARFVIAAGQPVAAALIVFVTVINYFGVRTAGRVQIILTTLKVGMVLAMILAGATAARHSSCP